MGMKRLSVAFRAGLSAFASLAASASRPRPSFLFFLI